VSAGLYLHLPFCAHHCPYCPFTISTHFEWEDRYFRALATELELVAAGAEDVAVETVYFGGGTPSRSRPGAVAGLLADVRRRFAVESGAEVTAEANPDDVNPALIEEWVEAGVTRVSLGVQSLEDAVLRAVERTHTAAIAREALDRLLSAGFDVSADLILGLPEQSAESFLSDAEELSDAGAPHLSIYMLELDQALAMAKDRSLAPERYLTDDAQAETYLELSRRLAARGYRHYEVSSWARGGSLARHNQKYWRRETTLAVGLGAHEFSGGVRRANTRSMAAYVEALEAGRRPTQTEQRLDPAEEARERIVLAARTDEGIPERDLEEYVADSGDRELSADLRRWVDGGILEHRDGRYALTERGFLMSNEVLCRFV
jgi:oxygen-independent coproporphyrinogen-3 oxidase